MADMKSKFSMEGVTTKQKVVGAVTIIITLFVIYEIVGLFSGGSSSAPAPAPAATSAATKPTTTAAHGGAPTAASMQPTQNTLTPVSALSMRKDPDTLKQQEDQQRSYLDSINQLQLLKLKREIAETNQAIATARLATETANKSMSDLLTQPSMPQVPANAYANKLAGSVPPPEQASEQIPPPPFEVKPAPVVVEVPFTVISVSMQSNRWNAVLGNQGKLYSVSIGDVLVDGSTVASINRNGVVLIKDNKRRKIGIVTSI